MSDWRKTLLDFLLLSTLTTVALIALQMAKAEPVPADKGEIEPAYSWMAYLVLGWVSFWAIVAWAAIWTRRQSRN